MSTGIPKTTREVLTLLALSREGCFLVYAIINLGYFPELPCFRPI